MNDCTNKNDCTNRILATVAIVGYVITVAMFFRGEIQNTKILDKLATIESLIEAEIIHTCRVDCDLVMENAKETKRFHDYLKANIFDIINTKEKVDSFLDDQGYGSATDDEDDIPS